MKIPVTLAALCLGPVPVFAAGVETGAEIAIGYDDNVHHLDGEKQQKLEARDPRFASMPSVDDVLLDGTVRVKYVFPGLGGRRASAAIEAGGTLFTRNVRRSEPRVEASLHQRTWKGGEVWLDAQFVPDRFRKNYLADLSGRWKPAMRRDYQLESGVASTLGGAFSAKVHAAGEREEYAAPFANRTGNSLEAGASLSFSPAGRTTFSVGWEGQRAWSARGSEVVRRSGDEVLAPSVDRSFTSHEIRPVVRIGLAPRIELAAGSRYRVRSYLSRGALDPYAGRVDTLSGLDGEARVRLAHDWRLTAGASWLVSRTTRPNDGGASDEPDWASRSLVVGISTAF